MLAVAAAAVTATVVPVAAAASSGSIVIDSVSSPQGEPGLLSVQAEAPSPITSLTVHIDPGSTSELTIQSSELSLTSGSAQDGTWTVHTPITQSQLSLGSYQVTVDATDSDGSTTGLSAPDQWFFGLYPAVTIDASQTTLGYSHQSVSFTGQVTADSPTGSPEGVANESVTITDSDGGSWSATTDQDGNYSVSVTPSLVNGTGLAASFSASVDAGPTIEHASSPDLELTGDVDPVQVSVALSKSVANFGAKVTFSGTARYQSDGIWLPFANSTVDISGKDYYSGTSVRTIAAATDDTGHFKVTLPAQPTTTWTANPAPSQYLTPSESGLGMPNSATLSVVLPTRTTRLHVAYNPAGRITAAGCLSLGAAVSSFPGLSPPADAGLYLQYSRTSRGPWRTLGRLSGSGAPKCSGGTGFSGTAGPPALSGHYRVRFTGQLLYQRSVSAAGYAATARTRITNFSIKPRAVTGHGRVHLSGRLQQKKARGWKALGGVHLTIYVKPVGSATWYYTTKKLPVSTSGRFHTSFRDPVSAHWAVGYPGNASRLESLSRILYVSASGTAANLRPSIGAHPLSGRATRPLLAAG
jgi:hypothetical protein